MTGNTIIPSINNIRNAHVRRNSIIKVIGNPLLSSASLQFFLGFFSSRANSNRSISQSQSLTKERRAFFVRSHDVEFISSTVDLWLRNSLRSLYLVAGDQLSKKRRAPRALPTIDVIMAATMPANAFQTIYIHFLFSDVESTCSLFFTDMCLMTLVVVRFVRGLPPFPTVETVCMDTLKTSLMPTLPIPLRRGFPIRAPNRAFPGVLSLINVVIATIIRWH